MKDSIDETMYFPIENGLTLSQDGVLSYSTLMVEGRAFSDVGQGSTRTVESSVRVKSPCIQIS